MQTFVVLSAAGPQRDLSKGSREQRWWDEHAAFIDGLVAAKFIMLGGPFADGGALLIVRARDADEVRERMRHDPWYEHGILRQEAIKQWDIFIDEREDAAS